MNIGTHTLGAGTLLIATDCLHAAVFQASGAASPNISHGTGGTPGNSTINLGSGGAYTFTAGARVYPLSATRYYVANNPAGERALYRQQPAGATATPTAEELVEGVENIQFSFGVDTDATPDGAPNFVDPDGDGDPYLRGDQISAATSVVPGGPSERWSRVVSVRISLLMRSTDNNVVPSNQRYTYNGTQVNATDRRLRKVFTHVIKLRNRG
jgi:type IV pilus assembly protein PilW